MNKTIRLAYSLLALVAFALLVPVAQAATATLRVSSVQGIPGSLIQVPIEMTGAPRVGALQLELVYDPAVLSPQEVIKGSLLGSAVVESTMSARGRVGIAIAAPDSLSRDGVIATVSFKAIGKAGQVSDVTLDRVQAWERANGQDILIRTEAGLVTITPGPLVFSLPAPTFFIFLFLMLASIVYFFFVHGRLVKGH